MRATGGAEELLPEEPLPEDPDVPPEELPEEDPPVLLEPVEVPPVEELLGLVASPLPPHPLSSNARPTVATNAGSVLGLDEIALRKGPAAGAPLEIPV